MNSPLLTLAQFSDTYTYAKSLNKLSILNPFEVNKQYQLFNSIGYHVSFTNKFYFQINLKRLTCQRKMLLNLY